MEVTRKQIVLAFLVVALACGLAGAGLAWVTVRWGRSPAIPRSAVPGTTSDGPTTGEPSRMRPSQTRPSQTQPASLMAPAEEATIVGLAVCSRCTLGVGPPDEHHVYILSERPRRAFEVLPNDQRTELTGITGDCAAGDYEVTATGRIGVQDGRNTIAISEFSTRLAGDGSDNPAGER